MEWGVKENRIAVIALHKCNKGPKEIFELLQPLQITMKFVYRTINRYTEASSVDDRPRSGRPRTIRTKKVVEAVRHRILRNPLRKQKVMAREMKIPKRTMSRIVKEDLKLGAYRRSTGHRLNDKLRAIRLTRSRRLLKTYAGKKYQKILFTDEKIFTIEEKFNRQNDRIYAHSSKEAAEKVPRVERGHHPASVMVWWGVSYNGTTELYFCQQGVKTKAKNYQEDILEKVVKPLNSTMFNNEHWIFQQDSAPAHKAKSTQSWLKENIPGFIAAEDWPSGSPDLNPLDYGLWNILEDMACSKPHRNIESLKASLTKAAADLSIDVVRTVIDEWPGRLKQCVEAKGGHFE